jgi:hypothetical protein
MYGIAASTTAAPNPRRRRWRRRLAVLAVLLGLVVLFHVPLLRHLGEFLVHDEPLAAADALIVHGAGDVRQIERLYKDGWVKKVVLIEDSSSRLARYNVIPTEESTLRRALAARSLPDTMLTVQAGRFKTNWDRARYLKDWLEQHPAARVIVLADEFDSREAEYVYRSVLGPEAGRVIWHAVRDVRYDPSNWWHKRQGVVHVTNCYVALVHAYLAGEPPSPATEWDPDRYEEALKSAAHKGGAK